jgi:hypothetical protein
MHSDVRAFFELIRAVGEKAVVLSPQELSRLLGVSVDQFELVGDWLLRNARAGSVSFELWLPQRNGKSTANILLSDARFDLNSCEQALREVFGPVNYTNSKSGRSGWATYRENETRRQITFIFDGVEDALYLEMIVIE